MAERAQDAAIRASRAVAIGVGVLKLFNSVAVARRACEAVLDRVTRVVASPSDRRLWTVDTTLDKDFDAKIGRFRGGLQLMASFGWVDEAAAEEEAINAATQVGSGMKRQGSHGATMGAPMTEAAA